MACRERPETYLHEHRVPFETRSHPTTYTAQELAGAVHVPGRLVAKVVVVFGHRKPAMLVLPATERVDLRAAASLIGAREVTLASERELGALFPDCEVGAQPPFGNLYGIPVFVEADLAADPEIIFPVGTHRDMIRMAYRDFDRLAHPVVGHFASRETVAG